MKGLSCLPHSRCLRDTSAGIFLAIGLLSLVPQSSFALAPNNDCVKGPHGIGLFGSTQTHHAGVYTFEKPQGLDAVTSSESSITLFFDSCTMPGTYLTLAIAPDEIAVQGGAPAQHYTGELSNDGCSVQHSPFNNPSTYFQRAENYRQRTRFQRSCVQITVSDLAGHPLDFPEKQTLCEITRLSSSSAKMVGGVCFFKTEAFNRLSAKVQLNPECTDLAYLKKNHIHPQEVLSTLKVLVSKNASGENGEPRVIGSTQIRTSIDPLPSVIPASGDQGTETPRWPTNWSVDTHFGRVKAVNVTGSSPQRDATVVEAPLFLDNSQTTDCSSGVCWGSSFYSTVLAGDLSLYEINTRGERETLQSRILSFILNPHWQGQTEERVTEIYVEKALDEGKTYEFEFLLGDISDDFSASLMRLQDRINAIPTVQAIPGSPSLPRLPVFQTMRELNELPQSPGLAQLDQQLDPNRAINDSLRVFKDLGGGEVWPPRFDKICNGLTGTCVNSSQKFHTKLTARFTVAKKGSPSTPGYVLGPQETRRHSSVFRGYEWPQNHALPRIECVKLQRSWYPAGTPKRKTPPMFKKGAKK